MAYSDSEIKTLIETFDLDKAVKKEALQEPLRIKFVEDYPIEQIKELTLDEYVCGKKKAGDENYKTFCYRIEFKLNELGSMKGGSSSKFGIFLSDKTGQHEFSSKYGTNEDEAFSNIKNAIVSLLIAAGREDFNTIEKNPLADIFKYKLLSTYYPRRYLPTFNLKHIEIFLDELGLKYAKKESFMEKQERLRLYKENNPLLKSWSLYAYMKFLYGSILAYGKSVKYATEKQRLDDKDYPAKYKSEIDISKEQWLRMLQDKSIFFESDISFLCQLYKENNHSATCAEVALKNGDSTKGYEELITSLAKRVLKYLGKESEIKEKGESRFWNVLFWGRKIDEENFDWKLRPKLADALITLYPTLGRDEVNDELDSNLTKYTSSNSFSKAPKEIKDINREKPEPSVVKGIPVYPRNRSYALYALEKANHVCEVDKDHATFTRRADGLPYTEPHHLIPMSMQGRFSVSIDVPENIVSLCSNCHNEIHYGADAEKLLRKLYEDRKDELIKAGIKVSFEELLEFYGREF